MPFDLDYDRDVGILRIQARGKLVLDEFRDVMFKITDSDEYPSTVPTLWDLCHFHFADTGTELARHVSEIRALFTSRQSAKIAFLVTNEIGYGMIRMLQTLTDQEDDWHVCYDLGEAERWLRVAAWPPRRAEP